VIALIDQALVSGINFVTAVVVARSLAPTSYGYYALLFAALLFINGLQTALITGPLMVIGPRQSAGQHTGYMNSLWVVQLLGCLAAGIAIVGLMVFGRYVTASLAAPVGIVPVLLVVVSYLAQEFARRSLFCNRDSLGGIGVDIISYGGQLLWIVGLVVLHQLTLDTVLWAMGLTSLGACIFGIARLGLTMRAVSRADLRSTCHKHWQYGRWLMSGNLAHWGATQFYIFVVAGLLSPAATGLFAAGRNLLGFTNPFLLGLENFVPATMTRRLINDGVDALEHWTNRFRLFSMVLVGGYCLVAALFADPLIHLLFGSKYSGAGLAVPIIALGYFIVACNRPTMFALRAIGAPRWSFFANAIAALFDRDLVPAGASGRHRGRGAGYVGDKRDRAAGGQHRLPARGARIQASIAKRRKRAWMSARSAGCTCCRATRRSRRGARPPIWPTCWGRGPASMPVRCWRGGLSEPIWPHLHARARWCW